MQLKNKLLKREGYSIRYVLNVEVEIPSLQKDAENVTVRK